jgi:hypothetical protein
LDWVHRFFKSNNGADQDLPGWRRSGGVEWMAAVAPVKISFK